LLCLWWEEEEEEEESLRDLAEKTNYMMASISLP
jgi:hypothetical protein